MSDGEPPAKRAALSGEKMAEDFEPYDIDNHFHLSQEDMFALTPQSGSHANWTPQVKNALAEIGTSSDGVKTDFVFAQRLELEQMLGNLQQSSEDVRPILATTKNPIPSGANGVVNDASGARGDKRRENGDGGWQAESWGENGARPKWTNQSGREWQSQQMNKQLPPRFQRMQMNQNQRDHQEDDYQYQRQRRVPHHARDQFDTQGFRDPYHQEYQRVRPDYADQNPPPGLCTHSLDYNRPPPGLDSSGVGPPPGFGENYRENGMFTGDVGHGAGDTDQRVGQPPGTTFREAFTGPSQPHSTESVADSREPASWKDMVEQIEAASARPSTSNDARIGRGRGAALVQNSVHSMATDADEPRGRGASFLPDPTQNSIPSTSTGSIGNPWGRRLAGGGFGGNDVVREEFPPLNSSSGSQNNRQPPSLPQEMRKGPVVAPSQPSPRSGSIVLKKPSPSPSVSNNRHLANPPATAPTAGGSKSSWPSDGVTYYDEENEEATSPYSRDRHDCCPERERDTFSDGEDFEEPFSNLSSNMASRNGGPRGRVSNRGGFSRVQRGDVTYSPSSNAGPNRNPRGRVRYEENDDDVPLDPSENKLINPHRRSPNSGFSTFSLRELKGAEFHAISTRSPGNQASVIDTHCHVDFLVNKLKNNRGRTNGERSNRGMGGQNPGFANTVGDAYEKFVSDRADEYSELFGGSIACFCSPSTFKNRKDYESVLRMDNVWGSFGCHPHWVKEFDENARKFLVIALKHKKVVAAGEFGLDYSGRGEEEPDREKQKEVFRDQLLIAKEMNLPIVIHCRDAHEDCIAIVKEVIPRAYLIHRHCVTQPWDEISEWREAFPNCYFGFTNHITYSSSVDVHDTVQRVPMDRILLETDAPYHAPKGAGKSSLSHPGMVLHVAAQIANLRGIPLTEVITACHRNTRAIYKFPSSL